MNRRDYLIGMGAATGAFVGATGLEAFAQNPERDPAGHSSQQRPGNMARSRVERPSLPPGESVKLVFHGLMAFSHNGGTECKVSFHGKDSADGKYRHILKIRQFRNCVQMGSTVTVEHGQPLALRIDRPSVTGAKFFQPKPVSGMLHPNDFRWVMDLEGPNFYDMTLPRTPGVYLTELAVSNALFYTLQKTRSAFRRQTADGVDFLEIGNVADIIAANIYLDTGGSVQLTVNSSPLDPLPQAAGVRYEIHFNNDCFNKGNGRACEFRPYHLRDKTVRNDFYMNFEGIDLAAARRAEYELVLVQPGDHQVPKICAHDNFRMNDEAPCSGTGFGGVTGFPPYPPNS